MGPAGASERVGGGFFVASWWTAATSGRAEPPGGTTVSWLDQSRVPKPREAGVEEEWRRKGATLSDKTARKEFGLTQAEIEAAIDAGQLQYQVGVIHGNPWLRLLRREVEDLMESTYSDHVHRQRRAKAELARVDRELKHLRAEVAALEEQRARLLADLHE
jgi:murein DD-endopeptidase MepM/ murein hydrolase activator NlpD